MTALIDGLAGRIGRIGRFVWGGWAALAALALFGALWQTAHEALGDFILAAPLATLGIAIDLMADPANRDLALTTLGRALSGFALSAGIGSLLGVAAGYSPAGMRLARPLLTVTVGVPPIAWIVLTLIWFGSSDAMIAVTILVATVPVIFAGAAEGAMSRDRGLDDMARLFGAGAGQRVLSVGLRHVLAHLLPALTLALGNAVKVAVMAELLSNTGGIGGALAAARANLDIGRALAWVMIAVFGLILLDIGLLQPVKAELERWRDAARPWGVKR